MNKKKQFAEIIKNYKKLVTCQKNISASMNRFCKNLGAGMNLIQEYYGIESSAAVRKSSKKKDAEAENKANDASTSCPELVRIFREQKNMSNVELYKKANVSKQVYSNIISGKALPKRETVIAIALALELNLEETEELLASAGHSFMPDDTFSRIVKDCILMRKNIEETNACLDEAGLSILGNIVK